MYVPLWSICREEGIEFLWDSYGRVATLRKNGIEAKLRVNSDKVLVGDNFKKLGAPVRFYKGMVVIPRSFSRKALPKIFKTAYARKTRKSRRIVSSAKAYNKIKKIVIDPGHGGKDPGAIGRYGLREKHLVLDISRRLKKILTAKNIQVILTRSGDRFVPLWKRANIANKKKADLFISVHANSFRKRRARGFEVYHLSEATDDIAKAMEAAENKSIKLERNSIARYSSNTEAIVCDLMFDEDKKVSYELARYICNSARKKLYVRDRGVKGARFKVLKKTQMPAVLVEVGFVSNRKEEKKLKDASYRQKVAQAIANGVLSYKRKYERENGFAR